jgi:murein DD-endopeptidase MepM/ murein hydrolase activator NlpD
MEYYYAHLSRLDVHAGGQVRRGQQLGLSGSANGSPHLHFASRHGDPGLLIGSPTFGYRDANLPG